MAKRKISFNRHSPKFEEYDLVLIVCEGEKTEPNYFKQLIQEERLSSANIVITGECGSDPVSVVKHSIALYKERKKEKNPATLYDRVYCVIDRDSHSNFSKANALIDEFNNYRVANSDKYLNNTIGYSYTNDNNKVYLAKKISFNKNTCNNIENSYITMPDKIYKQVSFKHLEFINYNNNWQFIFCL